VKDDIVVGPDLSRQQWQIDSTRVLFRREGKEMNKGKLWLLSLTAAAGMAMLQSPVLSQDVTRARTEAGKEVLLYPDGTWKYAEDKRPPLSHVSPLVRPPSAKMEYKIKEGRFSLWVDPGKWTRSPEPATPSMELELTHSSGDGYVMVIAERLPIPMGSLKEIVLENARKAADDAQAVLEERRIVNGHELLCLQIEGKIKGIPFTYYGYYYSGESGTVQVITYTGRSLFKEFLADFTSLLNGLEIH
jgi:hypothetical protein